MATMRAVNGSAQSPADMVSAMKNAWPPSNVNGKFSTPSPPWEEHLSHSMTLSKLLRQEKQLLLAHCKNSYRQQTEFTLLGNVHE